MVSGSQGQSRLYLMYFVSFLYFLIYPRFGLSPFSHSLSADHFVFVKAVAVLSY